MRLLAALLVAMALPAAAQPSASVYPPANTGGITAAPLPGPVDVATLTKAKAAYERTMIKEGARHCGKLAAAKEGPIDPLVGAIYYDLTRVAYQLADATGDPAWNTCATDAAFAYLRYVKGAKAEGGGYGAVPGYQGFSTGFRMHAERTGDATAKDAVQQLARHAAYASDPTPLDQHLANFGAMREVAYAVTHYINAEALGFPKRPRRQVYVNLLYRYSADMLDPAKWGTLQWSPFMVALTAEALIEDWAQTKDPRLVPALRKLLDLTWALGYDPATKAMLYQANPKNTSDGGRSAKGAQDLNMLIVPAYAWLYAQTGDVKYRDMADTLFVGGQDFASGLAPPPGAWITQNGPPKQYNQTHRYLKEILAYLKARGV